MAETKFGTFSDLMAITPTELRPIAKALRRLVLEVDPEAVEVVRLGDQAATYGVGPKKMSEGYAYIAPQKNWINLGFYKGADLPDPSGLMEGTGKKLRHVKIRSLDDVHQEGIRELVGHALTERKGALGN